MKKGIFFQANTHTHKGRHSKEATDRVYPAWGSVEMGDEVVLADR